MNVESFNAQTGFSPFCEETEVEILQDLQLIQQFVFT